MSSPGSSSDEADRSDIRLQDYLDHMREAARLACSYVEGQTRDAFLADKRTQQAVILNLIVLGEAATKIAQASPDYVAAHPALPWKSLRGMRNRIAHGYFSVDLDIVWDTVETALSALLEQLDEMRAALPGSSDR